MSELHSFLQGVEFSPIYLLPKKTFCERFGISGPTVDGKIRDKKWIYGREYVKDPDGNIHVNIINYQKWVESEWLTQKEKEDQYQLIEGGLTSRSTGSIQSSAQKKTTAGQSRHVKRIRKVTG